VYLLEREGVATEVDLDRLIETSAWLSELLGRRLEGQLYRAGTFPASA
jgi:hydroxymethylglutaryl-CoA lyase